VDLRVARLLDNQPSDIAGGLSPRDRGSSTDGSMFCECADNFTSISLSRVNMLTFIKPCAAGCANRRVAPVGPQGASQPFRNAECRSPCLCVVIDSRAAALRHPSVTTDSPDTNFQ